MNILVTGSSSGLGLSLARAYCGNGHKVYGMSRRKAQFEHASYNHIECDLADLDSLPSKTSFLLHGIQQLDIVILNAGVLTPFADLRDTDMKTIRMAMDTNVWSCKILLDEIFKNSKVSQVVAISSGASISGARGWNAYALSKATLNMLMNLYSEELIETHFCSLAPGLIDTFMQDKISASSEAESIKFPTIQRLKSAKGTASMPSPTLLAQKMLSVIPRLPDICTSGNFVDIRKIN